MVPILMQSFSLFFYFLRVLLIIRIILSWLALGGIGGGLFRFIYNLTEPLLMPIRNILHRSPLGGPGMMIDFSPIVLFILIMVAENLILGFLSGLL